MPIPIRYDASTINLSPRFFHSETVAASPAAATETTICTLTCTGDLAVNAGAALEACCSFTVGTSGVSATLRLRQTGTSGTTIYNSGANTVTAGNLYTMGVQGFDSAIVMPGQVYVLTLTIGSGAAASTVSAASIFCTVI